MMQQPTGLTINFNKLSTYNVSVDYNDRRCSITQNGHQVETRYFEMLHIWVNLFEVINRATKM